MPSQSDPSVAQTVFRSYLDHLRRRNLSPRTVETYEDCLATFGRWLAGAGGLDLCRATGNDLSGFQVWLSQQVLRSGRVFSPAHQAKHIATVRGLYRFLHCEGLLPGDPARDLRYPKLAQRIRRDVLSWAELQRLLAVPTGRPRGLRDGAALRLLAMSGLRASELIALDFGDICTESREVRVRKGKGARDRLSFFDPATGRHLARYLRRGRPALARHGESALIVGDAGRRLKPFQLRGLVRFRARRLGRAVTPHALRHTFCTQLLRAGANLKAIADLAGHASVGTTARYARVNIAELAEAYLAAHPRSGW